ncbi:MAG: methyl-accepting chemotaxis protein, partial [Comamonadaceae bacterium]
MQRAISGPAATGSVARRITLLALGLVALVLLLLSLAIATITTRSTRAQVMEGVGNAADGVAGSLDSVDEANRVLVQRGAAIFRERFEPAMQLDAATGELRSFGTLVNGDPASVDKFTQDTGGVATVFARRGDDFVRVTTSVKNEKGERAQGTTLDRASPAYPLMLKGESYTGRTALFGRPFMAHYEPRRDAAGQVIAILFVGNDLTVFQDLMQKQVTALRFFDRGGVAHGRA